MEDNCCTHYKQKGYSFGYIMFPKFVIKKCNDCGEVTMICNNFYGFIFEYILRWFWDGRIYINTRE